MMNRVWQFALAGTAATALIAGVASPAHATVHRQNLDGARAVWDDEEHILKAVDLDADGADAIAELNIPEYQYTARVRTSGGQGSTEQRTVLVAQGVEVRLRVCEIYRVTGRSQCGGWKTIYS